MCYDTQAKLKTFRKSAEPKIQIYCDADWAGDQDDRHLFSGIVVKVGDNLVQWKSSKQKCLSTWTMEAEYVSLSNGVKEAIWFQMILNELNFPLSVTETLQIYCVNRAAIDFSKSRIEKSRTKHNEGVN